MTKDDPLDEALGSMSTKDLYRMLQGRYSTHLNNHTTYTQYTQYGLCGTP